MSAVDLVGQIIAEHDPGCVVTKFVLVAELIGPDGSRHVWTDTDDAAIWDTEGLLTYALGELRAEQVAERLGVGD